MEEHPIHIRVGAAEDVSVDEKKEAHHDDFGTGNQQDLDVQFLETFPQEKRKAILRKIDLRLPPVLALLYLFAYLDRANIANAKIEGMLEDLHMNGNQYNVAASLFFVTYIMFGVPSNWILERFFSVRPSIWVGIICTSWGIVMTMHGVINNYASLLALRLLMGILESGFFPAAVLIMNKWYTKFEISSRVSIYYAGAAISGAFSGLLAYALAKMDGIGGYPGWRWIFLIEGIVTVVVGILIFFFVIDSPEKPCNWLTDEEREYCRLRIVVQDGGRASTTSGHQFSWKLLFHVITDWQCWLMMIVFWSNTIPVYGLIFAMPQIIVNMGFTASRAQLMTIPPYFCGAISAYAFGRLSDRFRRRSHFLLVPQILVIIGFAILFPLAPSIKDHVGVTFFAVILVCIGLYPVVPGCSAWISNNLAGPAKRAIGLAWAFALCNVGSIAGPHIYVPSEAPSYPAGFGCSLGFAAAGIVAILLLSVNYRRINEKRDKMDVEWIEEHYTEEQLAAMGDRSPLFRYVW